MSTRQLFHRTRQLLIGGGLVVAAGYGGWWWLYRPLGPPQFQTVLVTRGELVQSVTASGQLNPMVKVEVGSQVSGIIQKLLCDYNSPVKEGQVIANLDPASYEANHMQAEGNLAYANAALELARLSAQRAEALRTNRLIPSAEYDKAMADWHQAEANVRINEGALKKAQVDLARCTIYAPIQGVVISRNVNVGQTVAASLSAPVLFVIANDLSKMQIEANVAEADIGVVDVGQEVAFTVDAFPGRAFRGKVTQIRNSPKAEQNVVTYDTIIEVNNPNLKLKPGMSANVSIIVARREQALRVPSAALRFRPPASEARPSASLASIPDKPSRGGSKSDGSARKKEKHKTDRTVYLVASNREPDTGKTNQVPQAVQVKTGINDGTLTEVLDGLKEGDEVLLGLIAAKSSAPQLISVLTGNKKKH